MKAVEIYLLLARQALVIGACASAKVDLGGDNKIGTAPVKLPNNTTPGGERKFEQKC